MCSASFLPNCPIVGMQIDRRRVLQLADLLAHLLDDLRMAVADGDGDDAGEGVEILLARLVPQVLHVPFDDQQRIAVVRDQAGRQILLPQGEHFLAAGPVVGGWLVIADRQRGMSLSGHVNVLRIKSIEFASQSSHSPGGRGLGRGES